MLLAAGSPTAAQERRVLQVIIAAVAVGVSVGILGSYLRRTGKRGWLAGVVLIALVLFVLGLVIGPDNASWVWAREEPPSWPAMSSLA